jgi:uncharacterized membrane protein YfcA
MEDLSTYQIIIAIAGGLLAGGINTMVGSGSAITLSILTEVLGLPANVANGTNRVGVMAQSITTNYSFYNNGKFPVLRNNKFYIFLVVLGSFIGVYAATIISNEAFKEVFKYLLIVIFLIILIKPKRWLIKTQLDHKIHPLIAIPAFLALGFYGGFIQMGMGVFFLAIMVLVAQINIIESNVIKSFTVLLYTCIIIWYFHYKGLIHWGYGGLIAIGQAVGGYFMAEFASKHPKADVWAYRLLVAVVFLIILKTFGIVELLF